MSKVSGLESQTACAAFLEHLQNGGKEPALIHHDSPTSYEQLCGMIERDRALLRAQGVGRAAVLFVSEFSPRNISVLIALWLETNVIALSTSRDAERIRALAQECGAASVISVVDEKHIDIAPQKVSPAPPNVALLMAEGDAGFVVFSSGTIGAAKGVVHRLAPFFERHRKDPKVGIMLAFMAFDHIGGLATLFQVLLTHGAMVIPKERSPQELARCTELLKVNTLHVSPTLLNLVLVSGVLDTGQFDSLHDIYFGSEPISPVVLERVRTHLPKVRLTQLYGMSEVGVLPCVNKPGDSMWLKVDQEGYDVKVIDGVCHIKSQTLMLGYLSDEAPLARDQLLNSGDLGEVSNGYFRINGRKAHLINVGGINVSPLDIERVIEVCDNISDVVVQGVPNPILGEVVAARVVLKKPEAIDDLKKRLHRELRTTLTREEIPRIITISDKPLYSERFKKTRKVFDANEDRNGEDKRMIDVEKSRDNEKEI